MPPFWLCSVFARCLWRFNDFKSLLTYSTDVGHHTQHHQVLQHARVLPSTHFMPNPLPHPSSTKIAHSEHTAVRTAPIQQRPTPILFLTKLLHSTTSTPLPTCNFSNFSLCSLRPPPPSTTSTQPQLLTPLPSSLPPSIHPSLPPLLSLHLCTPLCSCLALSLPLPLPPPSHPFHSSAPISPTPHSTTTTPPPPPPTSHPNCGTTATHLHHCER